MKAEISRVEYDSHLSVPLSVISPSVRNSEYGSGGTIWVVPAWLAVAGCWLDPAAACSLTKLCDLLSLLSLSTRIPAASA